MGEVAESIGIERSLFSPLVSCCTSACWWAVVENNSLDSNVLYNASGSKGGDNDHAKRASANKYYSYQRGNGNGECVRVSICGKFQLFWLSLRK